MKTKNHLIPTPAAAGGSSCHGATQGSGSWLSRRRGLVLGGGAIVAGIALAFSQHWLTVSQLTPLLFALPCVVMMLTCMKGMSRVQQTDVVQSSDSAETTISTDATRR